LFCVCVDRGGGGGRACIPSGSVFLGGGGGLGTVVDCDDDEEATPFMLLLSSKIIRIPHVLCMLEDDLGVGERPGIIMAGFRDRDC